MRKEAAEEEEEEEEWKKKKKNPLVPFNNHFQPTTPRDI
jgi:hypothetical protein